MPPRCTAVGGRRLPTPRGHVHTEHQPTHGLHGMVPVVCCHAEWQHSERAARLDMLGDMAVECPVAVSLWHPCEAERCAGQQKLGDSALAVGRHVGRIRYLITTVVYSEIEP